MGCLYKGNSITVIIPCLNEEQGIERVLRAMPEFVDQVIVVDNASTDAPPPALGAQVIREDVRGYGRSYKRGFADATGDLIVTLDGDHSYPVDALSYLLEAFRHFEVDFLNASRFPVRDRQAMSTSIISAIWCFRPPCRFCISAGCAIRNRACGSSAGRSCRICKIESDGMSFSEEIKIEALKNPRVRFGEISIVLRVSAKRS